MLKFSPHHPSSGFTLIELLVVIAILGILASVVLVAINPAKRIGAAHDSQRKAAISQIRTAIQSYFVQHQAFPPADAYVTSSSCVSSWDCSNNPNFITALVTGGYLKIIPLDPTNDLNHHLQYYVFAAGTFGCPVANGKFYVLVATGYESDPSETTNFSCGTTWPPSYSAYSAVYGEFEK